MTSTTLVMAYRVEDSRDGSYRVESGWIVDLPESGQYVIVRSRSYPTKMDFYPASSGDWHATVEDAKESFIKYQESLHTSRIKAIREAQVDAR